MGSRSPHFDKWTRVSKHKQSNVKAQCSGCGHAVHLWLMWACEYSLVVRCAGCIVLAELYRLDQVEQQKQLTEDKLRYIREKRRKRREG